MVGAPSAVHWFMNCGRVRVRGVAVAFSGLPGTEIPGTINTEHLPEYPGIMINSMPSVVKEGHSNTWWRGNRQLRRRVRSGKPIQEIKNNTNSRVTISVVRVYIQGHSRAQRFGFHAGACLLRPAKFCSTNRRLSSKDVVHPK